MPSDNPLDSLVSLGQSVWLDFLERGFVRNGELAALIERDRISGVTANPAIFQTAIGKHDTYRDAIDTMARAGLEAHEIHEALLIEDIRSAADVLAPVFRGTAGRDGYVSLGISPHYAHDWEGTYWEAKRLWTLVSRRNVMIKVPGTAEAIGAVRKLIADGVNVNITLLFDVARFGAVADAYMAGLEDRIAHGQSIREVASVASFCVSPIDEAIDPQLEELSGPVRSLRGQCALACAHAAYLHYLSVMATARWRALADRGARRQRLLWTGTGMEDPHSGDLKYVDALIGPDTVATLSPQTLVAYREHGRPSLRLPRNSGQTPLHMEQMAMTLSAAAIKWCPIVRQLEAEAIAKLVQGHEATLTLLRERVAIRQLSAEAYAGRRPAATGQPEVIS